MSFSSDVKNELSNYFDNNRHCQIAELAAIINLDGIVFVDKNKIYIKIQSENKTTINKCQKLLKNVFNFRIDNYNNNMIEIKEYTKGFKLLSATGLLSFDGNFKKTINPVVISSICCKRAYIRAAFICKGSLSNPEKNYHIEFVNYQQEHAIKLKNLINSFGIDSKVVKRKGYFVVYIKEGEQIVDILNIMSAHKALMKLENVRILKGVRNNINRIVNCETANLNKTVTASVKQRQAIEYIKNNVGMDYLPWQLKQVAEIRLAYPDISIKEIGQLLTPRVGKSGVNHRLNKIISIAESVREEIL